jgi:hypothetical protein
MIECLKIRENNADGIVFDDNQIATVMKPKYYHDGEFDQTQG